MELQKFILRIDKILYETLREKSFKEHESMNKIINEILKKELEK